MAKTTKIVNCDCQHSFQDKEYGPGKRLANYATKNGRFRCTVCEREHGDGAVKKK